MTFRISLALLLVLVAGAGSGCAGSSHPTTIVCGTCEEPGQFVRLQARPLPSSSRNQGGFFHPLTLGPQDWQTLLESIRVQPRLSVLRKGDEQPAFTPEEIQYLSMTLNRAFAKASPDQWVVFGLSNPVPSSGSEMTTGAWYIEGTKLHLLLPNYHAPVYMDNVREVLKRDPLFEVLNATRYEFVPTPLSAESSEDTSLLSLLSDETPHLIIEYEKILDAGASFQRNHPLEAKREAGK